MIDAQKENSQTENINLEKDLQKYSLKILSLLHMAFKIAKIYKPNNKNFQRQMKSLFESLDSLIKNHGEATFMLRQSTLFLNGMKVRFGFSNYNLFRFINREFLNHEISVLKFLPGLSENETTQFVILFIQKKEKTGKFFESFQQQLKDAGIETVAIEKIPPSDMTQSDEKNAAKIFFLGIMHLKDTFEKMKRDERTPLSTTRRLMQSIFNHIINNESFTYGLTTIKNFDEYTLNHSVNVCILSVSLGRRLGLDRNELADLGISAFLHDFGKTEIPRDILIKPGRLNDEEREIIEKHPYFGAEKLVHLRDKGYLPLRAIHVAMEHHVKEDLTGYPKYKKKQNINLYSKIVKICDFYDALTTERPYRKKNFTQNETLKMMMELSGVDFDPVILKVFVNMMGAYPVGTLVLLSTREIGIVSENNPDPSFLLRPKVKLITDSQGHKIDGGIVDLTEGDSHIKKYKRIIVKSLEPQKYNINVSHYFLAQTQ